jgi:hypothetical protein
MQTIVPQDQITLQSTAGVNKFNTINAQSSNYSTSNKKQLLDASKRSGTTGGTSGTLGAKSGVRTVGNAAMINFANQNVYSSNESRKK